MTEEELREVIFPAKGMDKQETIEFWQEISEASQLV
jgi:hypothetical protein